MIVMMTVMVIAMDGRASLLPCFSHTGIDGETGCPNSIIETHFAVVTITDTVIPVGSRFTTRSPRIYARYPFNRNYDTPLGLGKKTT